MTTPLEISTPTPLRHPTGFSGKSEVKCDIDRSTNQVFISPNITSCKREYCNTSMFSTEPVMKFQVDDMFFLNCSTPGTNVANVTCLWNHETESAYWESTRSSSIDVHNLTISILPWTIPLTIFLISLILFIIFFPITRSMEADIDSETLDSLSSESMDSPSINEGPAIVEALVSETMTFHSLETESDSLVSEEGDRLKMKCPITLDNRLNMNYETETMSSCQSKTTSSEAAGKSVPTLVPSDIPEANRKQIDPRAYDKHSIATSRSSTMSLEEEKLAIIAEVLFDIRKPKRNEQTG